MISLDWVRALARYNRWMNDKLYALAAALGDEERKRDAGAFFSSIHGTFNHLLVADRIWLARFEGVTAPDGAMGPQGIRSLDQELYADFDELRRERALTDDALSAWVSELTDARLAAPLVFTRRGQPQTAPLWWSVAHLFNHQTHHRGQITTLLTQRGHDPGVTDLVAMLRDERARE
ncbi:MAG: damage-inducible protein DinB [Sandaracinaceae bacterium]|nr:damage-inducible protein DinB [Sandaracinaceae bacterium]